MSNVVTRSKSLLSARVPWCVLMLCLAAAAWSGATGESDVADGASSQPTAARLDRSKVDVMVVGFPHLSGRSPADLPPLESVRTSLARYAPDHIVVEWLHPGIDRTDLDAYRPLGDARTLARLWGVDIDGLAARRDSVAEQVGSLEVGDELEGHMRRQLGKLHYLLGDDLNAGYQWWLAGGLGIDVIELSRLTRWNFKGHELELIGFHIARDLGLERLTPFDYQGADAVWNWMEIVERVGTFAIARKHGLGPADDGFEEAFARYGEMLEAHAAGDDGWLEEYGESREVREFARAVDIWLGRRRNEASVRRPLEELRHLQSDAYAAEERAMYHDVYAGISLDGLGQKLVDNFIRRNEHMADFVEADIVSSGTRRVLVIVGGGHKPFLDTIFLHRGYRVVSSSDFMPAR